MPFWNKKELEKIEELTKEKRDLIYQLADYDKIKKERKELGDVNTKLIDEINSIKLKVREQTEADIFFTCAKVQKELLEGKTEIQVNEDYHYVRSMQVMLAQVKNISASVCSLTFNF